MAHKKSSNSNHQVVALAEKLFAANWQPKGQIQAEHIADLCLDAAEAFYFAVAERQGELTTAQ